MQPSSSRATTQHQFGYDGQLGQLYGIWLLNFVLKIITLGIYSFWGKTRLRRYMIHSLYLDGDRLDYTGTGGELFRGFLKALPIILIMYAPLIIYDPEEYPLVNFMFIPIIFLVYAGLYAAMRYRLSRTAWRGVRGKLGGSAIAYSLLRIGTLIVTILTLGIMKHWADVRQQSYMMNHMHFGSAKAQFQGRSMDLLGVHLITWLLAIPTLGLSRFWYRAALANYVYNNMLIGNLQLRGTFTGWNMLCQILGNVLIVLCTLGLGTPIALHRRMHYFADMLIIEGELSTSLIVQAPGVTGNTGEGVDTLLGDSDIGLAW